MIEIGHSELSCLEHEQDKPGTVRSECTLRSAAAAVKLDLDDSEQDTRETRKRKTQLPTKAGNPNGNQGVGLQRHREGLGPPTHTGVDQ